MENLSWIHEQNWGLTHIYLITYLYFSVIKKNETSLLCCRFISMQLTRLSRRHLPPPPSVTMTPLIQALPLSSLRYCYPLTTGSCENNDFTSSQRGGKQRPRQLCGHEACRDMREHKTSQCGCLGRSHAHCGAAVHGRVNEGHYCGGIQSTFPSATGFNR